MFQIEKTIKRGDVYYADLNPSIGSEQSGIRPVLIIQNDIGNDFSPTVIIVPLTSKSLRKHRLPTHVMVSKNSNMKDGTMVLAEQIRTIDKQRLQKYCERITGEDMHRVEEALLVSLGMDIERE